MIERLMDLAARACGFDRVKLRRRNIIPAKALPWRNPVGMTYDSGEYEKVMDRALELADWAGFPARRKAAESARQARRHRGCKLHRGRPAAFRASARISPSWPMAASISSSAPRPPAKDTRPRFSQIVAEWLGVPFGTVSVRAGDTDFVKAGGGSHSGRSVRFGSIVIRAAADEIIRKACEIAALLLQAPAGKVRFADGRFAASRARRSAHSICSRLRPRPQRAAICRRTCADR